MWSLRHKPSRCARAIWNMALVTSLCRSSRGPMLTSSRSGIACILRSASCAMELVSRSRKLAVYSPSEASRPTQLRDNRSSLLLMRWTATGSADKSTCRLWADAGADLAAPTDGCHGSPFASRPTAPGIEQSGSSRTNVRSVPGWALAVDAGLHGRCVEELGPSSLLCSDPAIPLAQKSTSPGLKQDLLLVVWGVLPGFRPSRTAYAV